jgi:predicted ATP-grasp superfamily ATP-dependent carboligase
MTNHNVIILGPDHYNTLWLVRSLGMAGITPFVIIHSANSKSFVSKSRYCNEYIVLKDKDAILEFLLNKRNDSKAALFTSSDELAELLDQNYNILSSKYSIPNCNDKQGLLSYWMVKNNMVRKAAECGLTIPASCSLSTSGNNDLSSIKYPCLIKPELSAEASKDNFRVCYNVQELNKAIQEIKDNCSRILVQEFIKPEYEYLIYGVSTGSEVCIPGGLHKIHTCNSFRNLGMMSYSCLSDDIPSQLGDFNRIKEFVQAICYKGLFSIEFMITQDKAYFLEINLRNDGTCYITTQAGVNMPAIWAYTSLGKDTVELPRTFKRRNTYGMNEINYLKYTFKFKHLIKCINSDYLVRLHLKKISDLLDIRLVLRKNLLDTSSISYIGSSGKVNECHEKQYHEYVYNSKHNSGSLECLAAGASCAGYHLCLRVRNRGCHFYVDRFGRKRYAKL